MTTTARRRIRRALPWALAVVVATVILLTFTWFVFPSTMEIEDVQPADAVVVFVGRSERLDTAVELMENGAAPNLVIPNGNTFDDGADLCEDASFRVFCPDTGEISTWGEAQTIGRLAEERGWTRLIAVTSVYHVHRATSLLRRCHDGPVDVVSPTRDIDGDSVGRIGHEWAGYLASILLHPTC